MGALRDKAWSLPGEKPQGSAEEEAGPVLELAAAHGLSRWLFTPLAEQLGGILCSLEGAMPSEPPAARGKGGEKGETGPPTDPPPKTPQPTEDVGSTVPLLCPICGPCIPPNSAREGGECPSSIQEPRLSLDLAFDR